MTEDLLGAFGDSVGPEFVAPLVTYLAHESCEPTGRVFSVGGGRVAEVFIGETNGWFDRALTPETVAEHWPEITDREGYHVPMNLGDETGIFIRAFLQQQQRAGT